MKLLKSNVINLIEKIVYIVMGVALIIFTTLVMIFGYCIYKGLQSSYEIMEELEKEIELKTNI